MKSLHTYQYGWIFVRLWYTLSPFMLYILGCNYICYFWESPLAKSFVILDINHDIFNLSFAYHMCMWISQEAGSSWECAENANIRSTLISDQGKSLYLHLPSQTWLTRSLKTANSSLLPVAFYLLPSRLAIYWQDLLSRSKLCAQPVHSHDTDVEYRRQFCQLLFFQLVSLVPIYRIR